MKAKTAASIAIGIAGIAVLSGCPFGASYSGPDACTLLTPQIAQSAIGSPARRTVSTKLSEFDTKCEYRNGLNVVTVEAGGWGWFKHTVQGPPISGIGDEAYMGPFGVIARKGNNGITVEVSLDQPLGSPVSKGQANEDALKKRLAKQLLTKL